MRIKYSIVDNESEKKQDIKPDVKPKLNSIDNIIVNKNKYYKNNQKEFEIVQIGQETLQLDLSEREESIDEQKDNAPISIDDIVVEKNYDKEDSLPPETEEDDLKTTKDFEEKNLNENPIVELAADEEPTKENETSITELTKVNSEIFDIRQFIEKLMSINVGLTQTQREKLKGFFESLIFPQNDEKREEKEIIYLGNGFVVDTSEDKSQSIEETENDSTIQSSSNKNETEAKKTIASDNEPNKAFKLNIIEEKSIIDEEVFEDESEKIETQPEMNKIISSRLHGKTKQKSRTLSIALNVLFFSMVIAILLCTFFFAISKSHSKSLFGFRLFNVYTDSMSSKKSDSFSSGDMILVKRVKAKDVSVGDIVTYIRDFLSDEYMTHRVMQIVGDKVNSSDLTFITRGDLNEYEDPPFKSFAIIGKKVFTFKGLGSFFNFIGKNSFQLSFLLTSVIAFFAILKKYLQIKKSAPRKER